MGNEKESLNPYDFCKYLMQEYPAEILKPGSNLLSSGPRYDIDKLIGTDNSNKGTTGGENTQSPDKDFYKCRIKSIRRTNAYYLLMMFLFLIQIALVLFGSNNTNNFKDTLPLLIIKIIGFGFSVGSAIAWSKQLWKNEEFYAWIFNYSQDEPIYEALRWRKSDSSQISSARIIIGDWLKNRPSLAYLLAVSLFVTGFHQLPYINNLFEPHADNRIAILLCEIAVGLICFVMSLPIKTDHLYLKEVKKEDKKDYYKSIWKIFLFAFILFIIFFVLVPFILIYFGDGEDEKSRIWKALFFLVFIVITIFVILGVISYCRKRSYRKKDEKHLRTIMQRTNEKLSEGKTKDAFEEFKNLSCSGQIKLLKKLQSIEMMSKIQSDAEIIELLADNSKTTQALDMVMDMHNNNEPRENSG